MIDARELISSSLYFVFLYLFIDTLAEHTSFILFREWADYVVVSLVSLMILGDMALQSIKQKILDKNQES